MKKSTNIYEDMFKNTTAAIEYLWQTRKLLTEADYLNHKEIEKISRTLSLLYNISLKIEEDLRLYELFLEDEQLQPELSE